MQIKKVVLLLLYLVYPQTKCLSQTVLNRIYIHNIHGKTCN